MVLSDYLELIRVRQWYKNLVVFLALFFSQNLFNLSLFATTLVAFFSLAFISSGGYILNDLVDRNKDRLHPEKKHRPLAAGKISTSNAIALLLVCVGLGLLLASQIGTIFVWIALSLFLLTVLYTFLLKNILFADVLTIAVLFVLRAIAGALAIQVVISPWLILGPFFLALFLSIGKRHAEGRLLKESATVRKVLQDYTPAITTPLMLMSTTLLIISYSLYSFLSPYNNLLYTLPFALFGIFRFYFLIISHSPIARHPEQVINDKPLVLGIVLWFIVTLILMYQ